MQRDLVVILYDLYTSNTTGMNHLNTLQSVPGRDRRAESYAVLFSILHPVNSSHPAYQKSHIHCSTKVKCTLVQALRLCTGCTAHRGSRGIALLFHDQRNQKKVTGQRHAPTALYARERPGTHCTGSWVGPRSGLDRCGKSRSHQDSIPGLPSPQPVAIPTTLPGPPCVHSSAFVGKTTSLNWRYTTSEAIIYSFIDVMFLITYIHKSGRFIRFSEYIAGWKTGEFCFRCSKGRNSSSLPSTYTGSGPDSLVFDEKLQFFPWG